MSSVEREIVQRLYEARNRKKDEEFLREAHIFKNHPSLKGYGKASGPQGGFQRGMLHIADKYGGVLTYADDQGGDYVFEDIKDIAGLKAEVKDKYFNSKDTHTSGRVVTFHRYKTKILGDV